MRRQASAAERFPPLPPIEGPKVILEHRLVDTFDLVVYDKPEPVKDEEGNVTEMTPQRRVKWVARLGRADDRDRLIPQEDGPPRAIPPGRAYPKQGYIGHIGLVHSPIVELTPKEWDELLESHLGEYVDAMIKHDELIVRESNPTRLPTNRRGKSAPKKAAE